MPTTTLSSDNVEVKVYAKNSESKIVSVVNTTIIYADPDITYLGYDITKQGDPGTDYEEGTIEDNFFAKIAANIINEANKFFFAKQTVEISLKFGTKNDINKVELYNVKEEAISSTEYSTKDQLRYFKFTLDLGIDEEFSVDMNDVDVIAYGPGRIISSLPKYIGPAVVPNEDSATMIVANGPAPSTINVL